MVMLFKLSFKGKIQQGYLVCYDTGELLEMKQGKTEKNIWCIDVKEMKEKFIYKFAINKTIRINDPMADEYMMMSNGEVWSVINNKKEKIVGYKDDLFKYAEIEVINKNKVQLIADIMTMDKIHTVSVLWYQSDGKIICFEEYCIIDEQVKIKEYVFELDLTDKVKRSGLYKTTLLIDGEQVYSNYFELVKLKNTEITYLDMIV